MQKRELLFVRFSTKEQTLFAKRLSFLIKAGVPILECLHLIRKQTKSKAKGRVYDAVIADVSNGQYLSTSLGKFTRLFGEFAVNIIRVGESSGILSQNLAYLADELSKRHALQKKVVGTLIYPVFITISTLGVTSILTVFIFPKLMPIFASLHVELPWTTRALIATSSFLQHDWMYLILGIVLTLVVWFVLRAKFMRVRYWGDMVLLYVPLAGNIARAYNLANFSRTLGLLLKSGVHLTESIDIVADTTRNLVYRNATRRVRQSILKGQRVSEQLAREKKLFPDMLTHMVSIGETTGNLSATCVYLGDLYEAEVDELTKSLSSSIEPVLMIFMGLLVGTIAVSVITPIYAITQHLQPK
ncbi:MAG: type II secretion system F family protein [Patescibacteria group bacterium]